jgi:hypothetical protein
VEGRAELRLQSAPQSAAIGSIARLLLYPSPLRLKVLCCDHVRFGMHEERQKRCVALSS